MMTVDVAFSEEAQLAAKLAISPLAAFLLKWLLPRAAFLLQD
jgi:hypothetical protein